MDFINGIVHIDNARQLMMNATGLQSSYSAVRSLQNQSAGGSGQTKASYDGGRALWMMFVFIFVGFVAISAFAILVTDSNRRTMLQRSFYQNNAGNTETVPRTEEEKQDVEQRRLERRLWYLSYLKPYTKVSLFVFALLAFLDPSR